MPNIFINEIDETTGGRSIDSTDIAYVPGFAEVNSNVYIFRKSGQTPYGLEGTLAADGYDYNSINADKSTDVRKAPMFACNVVDEKTWKYSVVNGANEWQLQKYVKPSPENEPVLCTSISQFDNLFGKVPYQFKKGAYGVDDWSRCSSYPVFSENATPNNTSFYEDGDYERSYIYARELLNLGLPVLYENIVERGTSGLKALPNVSYLYGKLADCYNVLTDKNEYQVKYLTSGAYPTFEYSGPIGSGEQYITSVITLGDAAKYIIETENHSINTEVTVGTDSFETHLIGYDSDGDLKTVRRAVGGNGWFSDNETLEENPYQSYIYNEYNDADGTLIVNYGLGANKVWETGVAEATIKSYFLSQGETVPTIESGDTTNVGKAVFVWTEDGTVEHTLEVFNGYYIHSYGDVVECGEEYTNESLFDASINVDYSLSIEVYDVSGVALTIFQFDAVESENSNYKEWVFAGTVETENKEATSKTTYFPAYDATSMSQFNPETITISYGPLGDRRTIDIIPGPDGEEVWIDAEGNSISIADGGFNVTVQLNTGWGIYDDPENIACVARAYINIDEHSTGGITGKMVSCAGQLGEHGRGDCVAIIDHTNNPDRKLLGPDSVYNALTEENGAYTIGNDAEFAAMFTPWAVYELVAENKNVPTRQVMPGSFAYLMSLARSIKTNANWLAIAGAARGTVPYIKALNTVERLSNKIANDLQPRNGKTSINPITNIKPYGLLIWGNRTMKDNSIEGNLTATSFLNIRNLVSDVKKQAYVTAKKYMFEQNTDILWVNFKAGITPLLDRMQSGQGLSGYKIIKSATNEKAKVAATIKLYPFYAIEDFEITVVISDEEITVE